MHAAKLIESLKVRGFAVKRARPGATWLSRREQELIVDPTDEIPDDIAMRILEEADTAADRDSRDGFGRPLCRST